MSSPQPSHLTADEYAEQRPALPDGCWTELVQGAVERLHPPEPEHGTVVLNLSKAIAALVQPAEAPPRCHACFDLGVRTANSPDTVRFPAVSIFEGHRLFAQTDQTIAVEVPASVMHIASDPSRRAHCAERVSEFHSAGVREVWIIDTAEQVITLLELEHPPRIFHKGDRASGLVWPELDVLVEDVFMEPDWYQ